jgi:RNA polymerase sigma-70 factor (ECF subfamily)
MLTLSPAMLGRDFDELIRCHAPAARALAHAVTGNAGDAEDIVQEALLAALEHRGEIDAEGNPKAWLLRVAHRKALDLLRRRKVRAAGEAGLESVSAPVTEADLHAVRRAFQKLPPATRAAMHLAYYEEMPYAEIADALDVSLSAVKMTILRGREALRALLKETDDAV